MKNVSRDVKLRLHVFLARHGIASRRACETLITEGKVRVNGLVIRNMGVQVSPDDEVVFQGKRLSWPAHEALYILMHKPIKVLCSHKDPQERPLALELVRPAITQRLFYVGRLDYMSSGLLLLTNDGPWAAALSHPSLEIEKEYDVQTKKIIDEDLLRNFQKGLRLDHETYHLKSYELLGPRRVRLVLTEGKNQEIRKVFLSDSVGMKRVHRVRFGPLTLKHLGPGQWRFLHKRELYDIARLLKVQKKNKEEKSNLNFEARDSSSRGKYGYRS